MPSAVEGFVQTVNDGNATLGRRPFQFRLTHLLLSVTVLAILLAAVVPIYKAAQKASKVHTCRNNLRNIALAIQWYHDSFNGYPAAYQCDDAGRPAHSWRVAILSFLGSPYAKHYDYSKPWDHPANLRLADHALCYCCPADETNPGHFTSYVAVVGPTTMWTDKGYTRMADLLDGTSNTIMVVEITNSNIHWMEPRDLPIEELEQWLDPDHKPTLLSSHRQGGIKGSMVVYADGHTEFLPQDVTLDRLRALLNTADKLPDSRE